MKYIFYCIATLISFSAVSQSDSTGKLTFSGYGEVYYSYDLSAPDNHDKPGFLYNHKRHNEINANLALIKASYDASNYRGVVALMAGNYAQYNLSAEPVSLRNIYEATAGVKLSKKANLWLDAGIMTSHIGFESAIGADCWTLSRSLVAENSPYYQSGAKLSFVSKNEKFNAAALVLNGWQHIQRPDYVNKPSFGFQMQFKPSSKLTINWSNFTGYERPDSLNSLRVFNNIYAVWEPTDKFGIIACFDIGYDKKDSVNYAPWYSPVLILRYKITPKAIIAARSEYYNDKDQIIIGTGTKNGFQVLGSSVNFDYKVSDKLTWRIEAKHFNSMDKIFVLDKKAAHDNYSFTTSLCIKL